MFIIIKCIITSKSRTNSGSFYILKFILLCAFNFLVLTSFGQIATRAIILKGKVTTQTGVPIENASVINIKEKTGVPTNNLGDYTIKVSLPVTLTISHLGFQTREVSITEKMIMDSLKDTLIVNIILKAVIRELKPIEVTAERIKTIYDKPTVNIMDYEFINNNILLLIFENKRFRLKLINYETDSVILSKILNFKSEKFFRDCFNNLQLLSKDSSYQIYVLPSEIYIYKGISLKQFNSFLLPCVASLSKHLILQQYSLHNQTVIYSALNKDSNIKKTLVNITNAESASFAKGELRKIAQLKRSLRGKSLTDDLSVSEHHIAIEIQRREWFYETTLTKQTYHPLKQIRDSIYIFNHIADSVYVYTNNAELERAFNIKYHYERGWKNEIISDEAKGKAYAKFIQDGITYLYEINLNTGSILNQYKLEQHTFPDKIKVKGNHAYYLYTEKFDNFPRKRLYKQKLY